jgi:hypothetical protein
MHGLCWRMLESDTNVPAPRLLVRYPSEANIETALLQVVLLAENLFAKAYSEGTLAPAESCPDKTRPKR